MLPVQVLRRARRRDRPAARARGRAEGRRAVAAERRHGSRSRTSRSCSGSLVCRSRSPKRSRRAICSATTSRSPRYILPCVEDRPLVMKRFPNGIGGKAFYQQRSREERPPAGVRIETLDDSMDPISEPDAKRLIGGSLTTLLYMTQIAAISQDPWFSRVQSPHDMDYCAIDLDPTDGGDVRQGARRGALGARRAGVARRPGVSRRPRARAACTSTSRSRRTRRTSPGSCSARSWRPLVATRHPKVATVERMVARRPRGTVYVDFLQNILGKTLATAYSARASDYAGVSTPLTWKEVDGKLDPRDFTIRTAPARFEEVGDLWKAGLRTATPADLEAVFRKYSNAAWLAVALAKAARTVVVVVARRRCLRRPDPRSTSSKSSSSSVARPRICSSVSRASLGRPGAAGDRPWDLLRVERSKPSAV